MRLFLTTAILVGMATAAHAGMGVTFDWGPTKKCFDSKSPPMRLSGVPDGTVKLDIRMVDRNAINFNHGGGKVTYSGNNSLPYGAFKYRGPCPPTGSHTYVFTVKALDAKGKTIGTAKASKKFP
jgi:phosphatidylethanolamine-binding protein (PEBP) family uncharacterized protein